MKKRSKKERRDLSPIHPPMPVEQAETYARALQAQKDLRAQLVKATPKGADAPCIGLADTCTGTYQLLVWCNAGRPAALPATFEGFAVDFRGHLPRAL